MALEFPECQSNVLPQPSKCFFIVNSVSAVRQYDRARTAIDVDSRSAPVSPSCIVTRFGRAVVVQQALDFDLHRQPQ
jgi:hypothetical protein